MKKTTKNQSVAASKVPKPGIEPDNKIMGLDAKGAFINSSDPLDSCECLFCAKAELLREPPTKDK